MPANKVRVTTFASPRPHTGASTGLEIGSSGRLAYTDSAQVQRWVGGRTFVSKTASFTITAEDDGKVFEADSTTSVVATLPAASSTTLGMRVSLVVGQLTAASGHAFSPAAADKIMGNGFTAADDKDAICSAATDRIGDIMTLVCDGVDGWYIESVVGTWAREA